MDKVRPLHPYTRAEKIQAIFEKYGTDKAQHGYAEFYARHLPENPKSILEIGVKDGRSIRAWRELFPAAMIIGMDLFLEFPMPRDIQEVSFIKANQCDWLALERLRKFNFEVIIDDGSHNGRDQMITFYGLAQQGCSYFIEDTHCNLESIYNQGLPGRMTARFALDIFTKDYYQRREESRMVSEIIYIKC